MTDVPGIMADPADLSTLVNAVDIAGAMELMRSGVVPRPHDTKGGELHRGLFCGVRKVFTSTAACRTPYCWRCSQTRGSGTMMLEELGK